jgi:uncharacterized protein
MKQISEDIKKTVIQGIESLLPQSNIYVFGSRVLGTEKKYSDLDVAINNGSIISFLILSQLAEIFANSQIPYKIDIVDYQAVTDDFRKIIDGHCLKWK